MGLMSKGWCYTEDYDNYMNIAPWIEKMKILKLLQGEEFNMGDLNA